MGFFYRKFFVSKLLVLTLVFVADTTALAQNPILIAAAAEQDWQTVATLVERGTDVNIRRADGATALLLTSHWDDQSTVRLLIEAGADVDASDDHGVSPLERASENASVAVVKALLTAGANPNVSRASGLSPLMTASRTGSVEVVQTLIDHGADVNATVTATNSTALMWAVSEAHSEIVEALLEAGADPRISTIKGFTPLMFAARNGDIHTAVKLIEAGVDVNLLTADATHILPFAITIGQDEFALFLLENGADPNGSMNGVSALHAASGNTLLWLRDWYARHNRGRLYTKFGPSHRNLSATKRLRLVKTLIENGANVNAKTTTSAMVQSYIGYPKKGAFEPFACGTGDLRGATPLWVAAYDMNGARRGFGVRDSRTYSSVEIMRTLLTAGADQHLTTDDGTTPFMAAAGLGRSTYTPRMPRGVRSRNAEDAVELLLEAGANINAVNEADFTALHGAAFRGLNEVVEYLVERGADINVRDFRGRTAFRLAEGSKQSFQFQSWPETALLLKKLGANANLGIPGTLQERIRDIQVAGDNQP